MMNVGILTFHFSDNYGAALQAYALRRWFAEHGHQASFIDYRPAHIEHGGRLSLPTSPAKIKANLKVVYLALSSFANRHFGSQSQKEKFIRFRKQFLGVVNSLEEQDNDAALDAAQSFDLIVAGSDQIWSPSQHFGFDPNYFLAFASEFRARKVSYAASFGRDRISSAEEAQLPKLLKNLDAISVRETSGVALVEQALGYQTANVPDPTLLHSDYSELTSSQVPAQEGAYVFCYALRSPDNIRQTADFVSKRLDCAILSAHNPHRRWVEIGKTVYPDPAEWVSLLKNARFVVTNSFHGTVFSLLFKKPFVVAGLTGDKVAANARAINLLRAVGLEDRLTTSYTEASIEKLMSREIDWVAVDERLVTLRQAGDQFLCMQVAAAMP
jgi:hypothetical protein